MAKLRKQRGGQGEDDGGQNLSEILAGNEHLGQDRGEKNGNEQDEDSEESEDEAPQAVSSSSARANERARQAKVHR